LIYIDARQYPMLATDPKQLILLALLTIGISCGIVNQSNAGDSAAVSEAQPSSLPVMPRVTVEASRIAPTTGTVLIDKELIENLPSRNGSVNEIIGIVPGVQFSETTNRSFTAGEITPPLVSISGSRFYSNNYTIEGISNNSFLDPAQSRHNLDTKLPGHPQMQFFNARLIDQITVYNSNIPAEYGGFTGGQVDVRLIDPDDEFWGEISIRGTRSHWTKFFISPADENKFYNSNDVDKQPKFKKYDFGLTLNTPISLDTSAIFSYQQRQSRIPLQHLGTTNTQQRQQENFLVKLNHFFSATTKISVTASYSPTHAKYFIKDFKDSNYTIKGGGYSLLSHLEGRTASGQYDLFLGFTDQKTERDGDQNRYFWDPSQPSITWSSGKEGALGPLSTGQRELTLKLSHNWDEVHTAKLSHQLKYGAELKLIHQDFLRPITNYYYTIPDTTSPVICNPLNLACIPGEQLLTERTVYEQTSINTDISTFSLFLQDAINYKRFEIIPGLRASLNSVTGGLNLAPRLSSALDVFGNKNTIFFAGFNRYYSGTLQTYLLYQGIIKYRQTWNGTTGSWGAKDPTYVYLNSDLKTPYSDETSFGIIQKVLGGDFKFQGIHKTFKDGFARSDDKVADVYTLNNNGHSRHRSYQVSWSRSWTKHFLELNSSWQETETSNKDYNTTFDDDDVTEKIIYNGSEILKRDLPRKDFNRPVVANLIYSGKLPYGLRFTNVAKFRGPYWYLKFAGFDAATGLLKYNKAQHHSSLIFDWRLSWNIPTLRKQQATLSLDINNVFNRRTQYGAGKDDYELGRQYWAGLTFNF
jgi:hypothetical protein